jgi:hypothetical protein
MVSNRRRIEQICLQLRRSLLYAFNLDEMTTLFSRSLRHLDVFDMYVKSAFSDCSLLVSAGAGTAVHGQFVKRENAGRACSLMRWFASHAMPVD